VVASSRVDTAAYDLRRELWNLRSAAVVEVTRELKRDLAWERLGEVNVIVGSLGVVVVIWVGDLGEVFLGFLLGN